MPDWSSMGEALTPMIPYTLWDRRRMRLTERAAELDDALTFCLAIHYGREPEHILSLLRDVFWRLPVEVRIGLLDDALWRTGIHDEVPFLVPGLRVVFRIRNSIAHSVSYGSSNDTLNLRSVKHGKVEMVRLSADQMTWAIRTAEQCSLYFLRIEGRIGGMDAWANLYGFAEH
jgi:hypothetical protein